MHFSSFFTEDPIMDIFSSSFIGVKNTIACSCS